MQRVHPSQKDLYTTYSPLDTRSRCHAHESEVKRVKRGAQALRKDRSLDRSTSQNTEIFLFLPLFSNMSGVEELYKQFGILADAKEKAGEVRTFG